MIGASLLLAVAASGHAARRRPGAGEAVPLFNDLGSYHRAISTKNRTAQKYFDQGLRLVYGFNHDEAERAFREAARLDPKCAICFWGSALTLGPNINLPWTPSRTRRRSRRSQRQSRCREEACRARVDRRVGRPVLRGSGRRPGEARRGVRGCDEGRVPRASPRTMTSRRLYAESMMDLRPWKFWSPDGTPAPGTEEIVATLESRPASANPATPRREPLLHPRDRSVEESRRRATDSAKRLETLVPGAGHLVHMPAHVYMRTGNYAGASEANAKAAAIDEKYIKSQNVQGVYPIMYYTHNLQFLAASAAMEGRSAVSPDAARKTTELAPPVMKEMPMAEFVVPFAMYYALRFEKVGRRPRACPSPTNRLPTTVALWHFGRAVSFLGKSRSRKPTPRRRPLRRSSAQGSARRDDEPEHQQGPCSTSRRASLDARLAEAQGGRGAIIPG